MKKYKERVSYSSIIILVSYITEEPQLLLLLLVRPHAKDDEEG